MTNLSDLEAGSESPLFPSALRAEPPLDDSGETLTLHQEINERRARIENAELLQNLRAL